MRETHLFLNSHRMRLLDKQIPMQVVGQCRCLLCQTAGDHGISSWHMVSAPMSVSSPLEAWLEMMSGCLVFGRLED